jgi:hypothetical protein
MRKCLLATTAMAALIGCTTLAMAQTGAPQPRGGHIQMGPGNTVTPPPSSNQTIPERLEPGQGVSPAPQEHTQNRPGQRSSGSVELSADQRGKIKQFLGKDRTARISPDVKLNVAVGAVIPKSVHIVVVPQDIVTIVPQYEGFDYVMVGDQILIINPDTLRIVAVIPA